jgi:hypothetical protein
VKSKKHLYGAAYANSRARDENKIIGNVERATPRLVETAAWRTETNFMPSRVHFSTL